MGNIKHKFYHSSVLVTHPLQVRQSAKFNLTGLGGSWLGLFKDRGFLVLKATTPCCAGADVDVEGAGDAGVFRTHC